MSVKAQMKEFLFGYKSSLLDTAAKQNPLLGGDPSLNATISLFPKFTSVVQSRNTGKTDLTKVNKYQSLNGARFINFKGPIYNGNETLDVVQSAWKEKVPLGGSDTMFGTNINENSKPAAFIPDIGHAGEAAFDQKVTYPKDTTAYRFRLEDSDMQNSK